MNNKKQATFLENKIFDYFCILKDEISSEMTKYLGDFVISSVSEEEVQSGGNQGGKDKIVILNSTYNGDLLQIPIYVEVKSHEYKTNGNDPDELQLYKKIQQVQSNKETEKYFREPNHWFSYLVFIPFSFIANQDLQNIISNITSSEYTKFPDHYWFIDNNKENSARPLLIQKDFVDAFINSSLFNSNNHSCCLEMSNSYDIDKNRKEWAAKIAREILKAKVNSEKNFNRIKENLRGKSDDKTLTQIKDRHNTTDNELKNHVQSDSDELLTYYAKDLDIADSNRIDYIVRTILIRKYGGSFGKKIKDIEEEYYRMTVNNRRFYGNYISFNSLEERIDRLVTGHHGFNKFDNGQGLIDEFLFTSEVERIGCFYHLITEGQNTLKLLSNSIEIRNDKT